MTPEEAAIIEAAAETDPEAIARFKATFPTARQYDVLSLQAELDELERTDPAVAAAAARYDWAVADITKRHRPILLAGSGDTTGGDE
jgi:hypothetical protein